jgi:hypothetical protein
VPIEDLPHSVILNDAARGLAQQMVFWGHDVRHPGGNLLIRHGLKRSPSPGLTGTSCYSMVWEAGLLELHGAVASWSAIHGGKGIVFCRDKRHMGLWHGSQPPVPGRENGSDGAVERRWEAFQPFLRWLISYERWVLEIYGEDWRSKCWRALKRLPKGKSWLPPELALKWWELAAFGEPVRPKKLLQA